MPIYVYGCPRCGHRFERMQSFSAEPMHDCPQCGTPARRRLTPPAIVFKGPGFYATDSRAAPTGNGKQPEANEDAATPAAAAPTAGEGAD